MNHVIRCSLLLATIGMGYLIYTTSSVEGDKRVNSLVDISDKAKSPLPMLPLAQQDGIRRIQLPSQVEVLVYEGQQDEAVDLDDMAFIVDDNEVRNVGPLLNANDMSLVYDDSPQRNVGPIMDANDMSLVYDDSPQRNVGPMMDANDMSLVYDDRPQRNVGPLLNANDSLLVYDNRPKHNVGKILDANTQ